MSENSNESNENSNEIKISPPDVVTSLRSQYILRQTEKCIKTFNSHLNDLMISWPTATEEFELESHLDVYPWAMPLIRDYIPIPFQKAGWEAKIKAQVSYPSNNNHKKPTDTIFYTLTLTLSSPKILSQGPYR